MPELGKPQNTIDIIKKYDFRFRKKFGQNFLIDTNVLGKIADSACIDPGDCVLELRLRQQCGRRRSDRASER